MSDKLTLKYKCNYPKCGYEFERDVGTSSGGKHSTVSTQVQCPKCKNYLPTWSGRWTLKIKTFQLGVTDDETNNNGNFDVMYINLFYLHISSNVSSSHTYNLFWSSFICNDYIF